jgi:hypothetical protein
MVSPELLNWSELPELPELQVNLKLDQKKGVNPALHEINPVYCKIFLVPEVGIEPTRTKSPLDFECNCLVMQSKMSERGRKK